MAHFALLGIEHLMTGLQLMGKRPDQVFQFERESASVVKVRSDEPFDLYWPAKQAFLQSTEAEGWVTEPVAGDGEIEWYAKRVAEALVDIDNRSQFDMQTYSRIACYQDAVGNPSRYAPGEPSPFPWPVVKAMRRKHGHEADKFLAMLRWDRDHWYYTYAGMYLGVEPDGYIHS